MLDGLLTSLDGILLGTLPYVVMALCLIGTIHRYRSQAFTYSSLSSQFLENRHHFWGSVPFHYGILTLTAGHLVGFAIPRSVLAWNAVPVRLYVIEVAAFVAGLLTLVGLVNIVVRRLTDSKSRIVTSGIDWAVYLLLLSQTVTGLGTAMFYGWGSSWFASSASPYLWSLVTLQPDVSYVTALPWFVKLHVIGAWLLIGLFPFSRLVHILVVPNPYLWRKWQMVRWYWDRRTIRRAE
ncbi:MAG: respiratory nitrate reductase subunit gamma [Deltaproteobacteria bacterium]|nr:respiratory nitrate reductase subunit gamma [Deltaproteobacteria bacterium]